MKILCLSPVPLGKLDQGVKIRGRAMVEALSRAAQVEVLSFGEGEPGCLPLPPSPGSWERLLSLEPPLVRSFRSEAFQQRVRSLAPGFDACFCLGLQMMQYARDLPAGELVLLDNFNVESDILASLASQRRGLKRFYWLWQAWKLRRFERWALRRAHLTVAICPADQARFQELAPGARVMTVAPGLALDPYLAVEEEALPGVLVFVGALDWHVNIEAARWMVTEVFPWVRASFPAAQLRLVGRNPAPEVRALADHPGVSLHADVPSVLPYLAQASVVVAPLRFGSGVQTKLIEALATGRPVITTSIGLRGLQALAGRDLLVADSVQDYARECCRALGDETLARRLGAAGRQAVRHVYSQDRLRCDVERLVELLKASRGVS